MSDATAANQDGSDVPENTSASLGVAVTIGEDERKTIVDTGKIPLFRYVWGIPPIASATLGADIWFKAFYYYFGSLVYADAQVLANFTAAASLEAGLDLFFDASLILGLVKAEAHAQPSIGLAMPLVIENNQFNSVASEPCFKFLLDVFYEIRTGVCPICLEVSGEENLIDEREPATCAAPGFKLERKGTVAPSTGAPAIAVDGAGETLISWTDDSGNIVTQVDTIGLPGALTSFAAAAGTSSPDVAYYGAGKAVMVWAQSSLSDDGFLALGDPLASTPFQQLMYRTREGGVWGNPLVLTPPTTGDGNVVLAACPQSDAQCPAGGEVLAVWVRDLAGDIAQHDLRLYFATFDGFGWTAPAPVDAQSMSSDMQATAIYADGEPVVAWVRNAAIDRSGAIPDLNLHERQIAYRYLRLGAGARIANNLLPGAASPSLDVYSDGSLALAYSIATDPTTFLGHPPQPAHGTRPVHQWGVQLDQPRAA